MRAGSARAAPPGAQEMCDAAGVQDVGLPSALGQGFILAGAVPGLPGGRPGDVHPAELSLDELWNDIPNLNAAALERVARDISLDSDVKAGFDKKVDEDVRDGRARHAAELGLPG